MSGPSRPRALQKRGSELWTGPNTNIQEQLGLSLAAFLEGRRVAADGVDSRGRDQLRCFLRTASRGGKIVELSCGVSSF
jgi:hypothetical protein